MNTLILAPLLIGQINAIAHEYLDTLQRDGFEVSPQFRSDILAQASVKLRPQKSP